MNKTKNVRIKDGRHEDSKSMYLPVMTQIDSYHSASGYDDSDHE